MMLRWDRWDDATFCPLEDYDDETKCTHAIYKACGAGNSIQGPQAQHLPAWDLKRHPQNANPLASPAFPHACQGLRCRERGWWTTGTLSILRESRRANWLQLPLLLPRASLPRVTLPLVACEPTGARCAHVPGCRCQVAGGIVVCMQVTRSFIATVNIDALGIVCASAPRSDITRHTCTATRHCHRALAAAWGMA